MVEQAVHKFQQRRRELLKEDCIEWGYVILYRCYDICIMKGRFNLHILTLYLPFLFLFYLLFSSSWFFTLVLNHFAIAAIAGNPSFECYFLLENAGGLSLLACCIWLYFLLKFEPSEKGTDSLLLRSLCTDPFAAVTGNPLLCS